MAIYKVLATMEIDLYLYVYANNAQDAIKKGEKLTDWFQDEPGPSGDWHIERAVQVEATQVPINSEVHLSDEKGVDTR